MRAAASVSERGSGNLVSAIAIALVLVPLAAGAKDAEGFVDAPDKVDDTDVVPLAEVKVTAERRDASLQKTPVTVNVLDETQIERRGIGKISDISGLAAGVHIPNSADKNTVKVFIRGIGSSRPIGNASVGWYQDDVYIPRSFGSSFLGSLPDIERIEILHGPQGTLYGQNTSSGALKFVSRQPDGNAERWASLALGNQGQTEVRGYLTGALDRSGALSGSLALSASSIDGDVHQQVLGKDTNGYDSQQFRAKLRFSPDEDFDATVTVDGLHADEDFNNSAIPVGYPGSGGRSSFTTYDEDGSYDSGGASLKLLKKLDGNLSLSSLTAARFFDVRIPSEASGTPGFTSGFDQQLDQRQYSQEFQLIGNYERLEFIAGLAIFRERFDHDRLTWTNGNFNILQSSSWLTSVGVFGQGTWKFTEKLGVTAGLRLNKERREMDSAAYASNQARERLSQTYRATGLSKDYSAATPKLSLQYQWTPDTLAYASWAIGETSGGWNAAAATLAIAQVPVDPEEVTAYELGLKNTAFGGRLRQGVSFFYNDYTDYQASITNPTINGQLVPGAVIVNAGKAHTYGIEFEAAARLVRNLELSIGASYLKAEFDEFLNPTGVASSDFSGADLPYAPRWGGYLGLDYSIRPQAGGNWRLNALFRAEDESYTAISTTREYTKAPAQNYLDAGVFYTVPSGRWTLSLTAKNLLDRQYRIIRGYVPALGIESLYYNRERQLLFGIRGDF